MANTTKRRGPALKAPSGAAAAAMTRVGMPSFSTRLYELRTERGWSMSDLARKLWGTTTDSRGYTTPKNKALISRWERGESTPEPQNLKILADAFDIPVEELAPDLTAVAVKEQPSAVSLQVLPGHPDQCLLVVNVLCGFDTAAEIMKLLSKDPTAANFMAGGANGTPHSK